MSDQPTRQPVGGGGARTAGQPARSSTFPFSAVVGMDDMGLALCLAAVAPGIGGVLVRGEKGTAKSTMVRALAEVLPPVDVIEGCRFACAPGAPDPDCPDADRHNDATLTRPVRLVELPVGASEDRVVGSLHLSELLSRSVVEFEPGLLAQAHRGVLYVDEVNLLPDHLVDTLLDSAAMGRARVEREGVSVTHAAQFVLVGTMNPEEGELRPQLLDRFGLAADVAASRDIDTRVEVVRRRLAFEADPAGFVSTYAEQQDALAARIARAEELLPRVTLTDAVVRAISTICARFDVDGMRGDLVTARTACAHAAWRGRTEVTSEDVRIAARLALPHRRRRTPFDDHGGDDLEEILDEVLGDEPDDPTDPDDGPDDGGPESPDDGEGTEVDTPQQPESVDGDPADDNGTDDGSTSEQLQNDPQPQPAEPEPGPERDRADDSSGPRPGQAPSTQRTAAEQPYRTRLFALPHAGAGVAGRRSAADVATGRHVRAVAPADPRGRGIALTATVLAAATRIGGDSSAVSSDDEGNAELHGEVRSGSSTGPESSRPRTAIDVDAPDLRRSIRRGKEGNLVVFAVDTSGSMGAAERIRQVKTACVSLLLDAYQRRDKVAVVTFAKRTAHVVLPPTSSVDLAQRLLADVPTGGRTPLAEGLITAYELIRREQVRDPHRRALLVVLTDGRASAGGRQALPRAHRVADGIAEHAARTGRIGSVVVDCESDRAGFRLGLARDLAVHLRAEYVDLPDLGGSLTAAAAPARSA